MNSGKLRIIEIVHASILLAIVSGCANLAAYDQKAYENATSLKVQTAAFISTAGNACQVDKAQHAALNIALETAYEYAHGVDYNNEASKNWRMLIDNLIGSYFQLCEAQDSLSPDAFDAIQTQIRGGFDTLICLEANKRQLTKCATGNDAN